MTHPDPAPATPAEVTAAQEGAGFGWEYSPGWVRDDGTVIVIAQGGTIAPGYVADYIAEGGAVLRRLVGPYEPVTREAP